MIRKVYKTDPLQCPRYGGRMRVIAFIEELKITDRIIRHFKLTFNTQLSGTTDLILRWWLLIQQMLDKVIPSLSDKIRIL